MKGLIKFTGFGLFWFTGQKMGNRQCPVKADNWHLRDLIHAA